ncbi:MAG TPA: hypothetical protein VG123_06275 [Streptosporangiaceae bacterium]|nr:hypothetical protein [Streptosporangiaceae bacterium]
MTAAPRGRRWPPTSGQAAGALGGLALLLVAASVALTGVTGDLSLSGEGGTIALALTFLAMGFLVAVRQPRNPIGWLLMVTGTSSAFTTAAGLYTLLDYGSDHGSLPFGLAVFLAQNTLWPMAVLTGMAAVLLFPDGRLSRPWRRALWGYVAAGALVLVSQAIPAARMAGTGNVAAIVTGHLAATPPGGGAEGFLASGLPVLAVIPFWVAWIVRQVACFRRAHGDVREQYKWFTAGAAISLVGIVVLTVAESNGGSGLAGVANTVAIYATGVAFPLGMGVAILRYRLYEIDRIISRTLAYTIVTGLLVGVYAGLVLLATRVLGFTGSVSVAASTLAAAALFAPLRGRVQRIVDHRFNRARYDADRTIAAFAARLQGAVDLDTVRADLTGVVGSALEPAHVSLWVAGGDR